MALSLIDAYPNLLSETAPTPALSHLAGEPKIKNAGWHVARKTMFWQKHFRTERG
jgi:hypothetical protein